MAFARGERFHAAVFPLHAAVVRETGARLEPGDVPLGARPGLLPKRQAWESGHRELDRDCGVALRICQGNDTPAAAVGEQPDEVHLLAKTRRRAAVAIERTGAPGRMGVHTREAADRGQEPRPLGQQGRAEVRVVQELELRRLLPTICYDIGDPEAGGSRRQRNRGAEFQNVITGRFDHDPAQARAGSVPIDPDFPRREVSRAAMQREEFPTCAARETNRVPAGTANVAQSAPNNQLRKPIKPACAAALPQVDVPGMHDQARRRIPAEPQSSRHRREDAHPARRTDAQRQSTVVQVDYLDPGLPAGVKFRAMDRDAKPTTVSANLPVHGWSASRHAKMMPPAGRTRAKVHVASFRRPKAKRFSLGQPWIMGGRIRRAGAGLRGRCQ